MKGLRARIKTARDARHAARAALVAEGVKRRTERHIRLISRSSAISLTAYTAAPTPANTYRARASREVHSSKLIT